LSVFHTHNKMLFMIHSNFAHTIYDT
jgi:hypothetical protein